MLCCFLCCMKQKWSVNFLTAMSAMLFLAAAFVLYISVALYSGSKVFGGNLEGDEQATQMSLDSYYILFSVFTACVGIVISFLGCCTARMRDRCSVGFFTVTTLIFCIIYLFSGSLMMILNDDSAAFVNEFCASDHANSNGT